MSSPECPKKHFKNSSDNNGDHTSLQHSMLEATTALKTASTIFVLILVWGFHFFLLASHLREASYFSRRAVNLQVMM